MALHIVDKQTDRLVRQLARKRGVGLTEAVKLAVEAELQRTPVSLRERLERFLAELDATPRTGQKVDKAFFDELSGLGVNGPPEEEKRPRAGRTGGA